jgi:peroxiredoxin Q/BCP
MVRPTGAPAPTFAATDQFGRRVTVEYDRPTVLFFYPRDGTPGCTTEATEFDDLRDTFEAAGVAVYGLSTDDEESHRAFAADHDIEVPLLADPEANVAEAFEVPVTDGAARRTTVVVVDGTIRAVYEGVAPGGHARDIVDDLAKTGLVQP